MSEENQLLLKRSIIALLFKLCMSDHEITESEISYIFRVGKHIGVSDEEIFRIQKRLHKYVMRPPKNEKDRMTILYYLLFLMKIDGKIQEEEVKLIQEFSFRLGFRSTMTDEMILTVREHVEQKLTPDQLLETIRKYHN